MPIAADHGGALLSRSALRLYAASADACPRLGMTDPRGLLGRADPDESRVVAAG